jgi:hypothetical protein
VEHMMPPRNGGKLRPELFPALLAQWLPPSWATSTEPLDHAVAHSRARSVAGLDVRLVQVDAVEVGDHGHIRVVRRAATINIEEHTVSLDGAAALARALAELVAAYDASTAPPDRPRLACVLCGHRPHRNPCASCSCGHEDQR